MPHGSEIYIGFSPLHPFIVDTQFKKKKLLRKAQNHYSGGNRIIRWESTILGGAVSTLYVSELYQNCPEAHSLPHPARL